MRKIGLYLILAILLSSWAMWYQSTQRAISLCESDLAACEAEYFAD